MVDLQSGRNLVMRAVVELSKTKSEVALPHQLFPTRVGGQGPGWRREERHHCGQWAQHFPRSLGRGLCVTLSTTSTTDGKRRRTASRSSSLSGAIEGSVSMSINGKVKVVTGFSQVRKLFSTEFYRVAKLRPRDSDVDFSTMAR